MDIEELRKLSQSETTSPEILAELANNKDNQIRKNVAGNPNTPAETLLGICFEFPKEVINNPVIPLLILENPDLLTCKPKINLDFAELKQLTDVHVKRLGWTIKKGQKHLIQTYGKKSRLQLTDAQLYDFLCYLIYSNPVQPLINSIKSDRESTIESNDYDEIPF